MEAREVGLTPMQRLAEDYTRNATAYAELWSPVIRPMGERLLDVLPLHSAQRILDVGTGVGALLPALAARTPHASLMGVDRSEGMLRVAQRLHYGQLVVMDAMRLAFHAAAFDVVLLAFVLFHLPDPLVGLQQGFAVLRPGGTIGVVTWGDNPGLPAAARWEAQLEAYGAGPDPRDPEVAQHARMDTPDKLQALLEQVGFTGVRAWTDTLVHHFDPEQLLALQVAYGGIARRLASLPSAKRAECAALMREQVATLSAAELRYTAEVVFAVASRPSTSRLRRTHRCSGPLNADQNAGYFRLLVLCSRSLLCSCEATRLHSAACLPLARRTAKTRRGT